MAENMLSVKFAGATASKLPKAIIASAAQLNGSDHPQQLVSVTMSIKHGLGFQSSTVYVVHCHITTTCYFIAWFLADDTNSHIYASVVQSFVRLCTVAKRAKVTIESLYEVIYEKSIGTKMNDLDLCLEVIKGRINIVSHQRLNISKTVRARLGSRGPPIENGVWGIKWPRDR